MTIFFKILIASLTPIICFGQSEITLSPKVDFNRLQHKDITELREIYRVSDNIEQIPNLKLPKVLKNSSDSFIGIFTLHYYDYEIKHRFHTPYLVDYSSENWIVYKSCKKEKYDFSNYEIFTIHKDSFVLLTLEPSKVSKIIFKVCQPGLGASIKNRPKASSNWRPSSTNIAIRNLNIFTSEIPDVNLTLGFIDKTSNGEIFNENDEIFIIRSDNYSIDYMMKSSYSVLKKINYIMIGQRSYKLYIRDANSLKLIYEPYYNIDSLLILDSFISSKLNYQNLEGLNTPLSSVWKDKCLLINFWGTWCRPCVEKVPELNSIYLKYGNQLEILSLNFRDKKQEIIKFNEKNEVNWLQGYRTIDISNYFGQNGYPFMVLISRDGKVVKNAVSLEEVIRYLDSR